MYVYTLSILQYAETNIVKQAYCSKKEMARNNLQGLVIFNMLLRPVGDVFILFKLLSFPLQGTISFHFKGFGTYAYHLKTTNKYTFV